MTTTVEVWAEIAGYVASALVFLTFCMKTIVPLRLAAILSNLAFIAYGAGAGLMPVLILHAALLPLNVWRTVQQVLTIRDVRRAAQGNVTTETLIPHMQRVRVPDGTLLFRKGDEADAMYLVGKGRVRLTEIDKIVEDGTLLGEVGLFAADNRRTLSAETHGDAVLYRLDRETMMHLFHTNPAFGFYMTRLIATRMSENQTALMQQSAATFSPGPEGS